MLWRNVTIVAWLGKPTGAATRELGTITKRALNELGTGTKVSNVHLIPISLRLPDAEARAGLHEVTQHYGQYTACVGVIVSGSGFWASAVRGVVTGVQVIAPRSFEMRIHTNSTELLDWLPREHERRTGVAIEGAELQRQIEQAEAWQRAAMPAENG